MPDRWALALLAATVAGTLAPHPLPVALGAVVAGVALKARSPALLCAGGALLASALSYDAWAGLDGVEPRPIRAEVVLVSDPEPARNGVRADVRWGGRRLELRASGAVADDVRVHLAGERLLVRGEVAPAPPDAAWLVPRHVAGTLEVHRVERSRPAAQPYALANELRERLARGATSLDAGQQALFAGLVVGDDRDQPVALTDAFRGAGLTHLLAVSGQNVAFVLVLLGPLARRLALWPRLLVTLGAIGLFGLVTRFEPSVLRASAMAAVAALSLTVGRPMARVRVLALAATGLLLVDPLLVHAVGFRLSVLAAASIVAFADRIAAALPGPGWLRTPMSVTLAAQLGVAPVLLATFGPMPVASIPANLLAVPVAGFVMVWGLTAGMVAGVLGDPAAPVLHLPTRAALGWIEAVAQRSADAPLGELRGVHLLAIGAGLAVAVLVRTHGRRPSPRLGRRLGLGLAGSALAAAVLVAHAPPPLRSAPRSGIVRWHAGGTDVVALGGGGWRSPLGTEAVLETLRRAGVGSIDALVIVDPSVRADVVDAITREHPTGSVLVPPGAAAGGVILPAEGVELEVGHLRVVIVPGEERLVVDARPRAPDGG